MKLTSGDLLLLLLYARGHKGEYNEAIEGRTRLVKMVFIFEKEIYKDFSKDSAVLDEKTLPEFFAWDFGPMSKDVLQDLEFFKKVHFVDAVDERNSFAFDEAQEFSELSKEYSIDDQGEQEYIPQKYLLSAIGRKYVETKLYPSLSDNQKRLLDELKQRFTRASLAKIIEYVYRTYPDYATKSKIADKVMK